MASRSEGPLKRLIREIHRRSLWQVLGIYLVGGWIAYQIVHGLTEGLVLPEWFPALAVVLLVIGLPIVLATAFVQEGKPGSELDQAEGPGDGDAAQRQPETAGTSGLFTWRNAILGGVGAFALWGVLAAGWLVLAGGTISTDDSASIVLSAVAEVDDAMDRGDWIEAYRLASALPPQVPDSAREAIFSSVSTPSNVLSDPEGASVSWRPYDHPDMEWEADKDLFVAEGGHTIPLVDLTRETLDWFDRYLGEVR